MPGFQNADDDDDGDNDDGEMMTMMTVLSFISFLLNSYAVVMEQCFTFFAYDSKIWAGSNFHHK